MKQVLIAVIVCMSLYASEQPSLDIRVQKTQTGYVASAQDAHYRCNVGASGIRNNKVEGDRATPAGTFVLRKVFYRPDRISASLLNTKLPIQSITPHDGWCDDPNNPQYNQLVDLRTFDHTVSHETLWRKDALYDILVVIGHNDNPAVPGKGSAIFIHIARPNYTSSLGCIVFSQEDLLKILAAADENSTITLVP